ncbi:unnamed protein product [Nezara viridula]|uniref:Neuropeptide n=1 Tax=Nezara viridula TaxID=85310 RepID=A0A9P0HFM2_NEZVI|nr:unnamed protein product [Nezara viridula]
MKLLGVSSLFIIFVLQVLYSRGVRAKENGFEKSAGYGAVNEELSIRNKRDETKSDDIDGSISSPIDHVSRKDRDESKETENHASKSSLKKTDHGGLTRSKRETETLAYDSSHHSDDTTKKKSKSAKLKLAAVCKSGKASRNLLKAIEQNSNDDSEEKVSFIDDYVSPSLINNHDSTTTLQNTDTEKNIPDFHSESATNIDELQRDTGKENQGSNNQEMSSTSDNQPYHVAGSGNQVAQNVINNSPSIDSHFGVGETGSSDKETAQSKGTQGELTDESGSGQHWLDWFAGLLQSTPASETGENLSNNGPTATTETSKEVSGSIGTPAAQFSAGFNSPTDQNGANIQHGETDPTASTSQISSSPLATSNHLINGIRAPLQSQSLTANSNTASLGASDMYSNGVPEAGANGEVGGSIGTPASQFSAGLNMPTDQNGDTIQYGETNPTATTSQINSSPSATSNHLMNGIRAPLQSQSLTANSNGASLGTSAMYNDGVSPAEANGEFSGSAGTPAAQFSAGLNMPTDQNGANIQHGETDPTATTSQISSSPLATSNHIINGIRAPLQSQSLTANSNTASLGASDMYSNGVPEAGANGEVGGSIGTPASQFSAGLNMPTDQNGDTIQYGETNPTATTSQITSSPSATSNHLMNGIRAPLQSQSLNANSNGASLGTSAMYNDGVPVAEGNGKFSGSVGTPAAQFSAGLNMPTDQNGATIQHGETDPTATTSQISSSPSSTSNHLMNGIRAPLQSQSLTANSNAASLGVSDMYSNGVPEAGANGEFGGSRGTPAAQFSAGMNMPTDQNGATIQHGETDPTATTSQISSSPSSTSTHLLNGIRAPLQSQSLTANSNAASLGASAMYNDGVPVAEANGEFSGSAGTPAAQFSAGMNMPTDQNGATDPTATTSQISSSPSSTSNHLMNGIRAPLQSQSLTANSNAASLGASAMYNDGVPVAETNGEFSGSEGTPAAIFSAGLNMPTDQNGATIQHGETDPTATTSQISSSPSATSNHLMNGIRAPLQSQSLTDNRNGASLGTSAMYNDGVPVTEANGEFSGSAGTPAAQFSAGLNMPTDQNGATIQHGETDPTAKTSQISSSEARAPVTEANGEFSGSAGTPAAQFSAGLNMPTDQNGATIQYGETDPTATTSQISSSPTSTTNQIMNGIRAPLQSQSLTANSNGASLGTAAMYNDGVPPAEANGELSGSAGTPAAQFSAGLNMPTDQNGATIQYGETDPTATTSQISSSPSATSNHLMNGIRAPLQSQSLTANSNGASLGTSAMYNDGVPPAEANGELADQQEHQQHNSVLSPLQSQSLTANSNGASLGTSAMYNDGVPAAEANGEFSGSAGTPAAQFSAGLNMPTDQNGATIQYGETDKTATTSQISSSPSATSNHLMNGIRAPLQSQSLTANSNGALLGTAAMYNDGVPPAEANSELSGSAGTPAAQFSAGLNMPTDQNGATIQYGETDPTATTSPISSSPTSTTNQIMNGIRAPLQSQSLTANSNGASLGTSAMYNDGVPPAEANGEFSGSAGTPAAQFSAGLNMPTDQNGATIQYGETDPTATTSQISSSPTSTTNQIMNGIRAPLQSQSLTANSNGASLGTSAMYNDGVPPAEANGEFSGSAGTPAAQFSAGLNMPTDQNGATIQYGETDPTATTSQISSSPTSTTNQIMNGIRAPLQSQSLTANSNGASLGTSAMYNDGVPAAEANGEFSGSAGTPAAQFSAGLNMPTDQNGATIQYGETDPTATTSQISSSPTSTTNQIMKGIRAPLQSQSLTANSNGASLGTSAMYNDGVPPAEANGEFSGSAGTPAAQFSAGLNMPTDQNGATIQYGETDPTATTSQISSSPTSTTNQIMNGIRAPLQSQSLTANSNGASLGTAAMYNDGVPPAEANGELSGSAGTPAAQFSAGLNMPTDQNGATIQYGETDPTATTSQISSSPTSTTNQIMKGIRAPLQSQSLTANSNGASLGTSAMYNDGVPPAEANGEFSGSAGTPAAQFSAGLNMPTDQNGATIQYGETDPTATTSQISSSPTSTTNQIMNGIRAPLQSQSLTANSNGASLGTSAMYNDGVPAAEANGEFSGSAGTPAAQFSAGLNMPTDQNGATIQYGETDPTATTSQISSSPTSTTNQIMNGIRAPLQSQSLTANSNGASLGTSAMYNDGVPTAEANGEFSGSAGTPAAQFSAGLNMPTDQNGATIQYGETDPTATTSQISSSPLATSNHIMNGIRAPLQSQSLTANSNGASLGASDMYNDGVPEAGANGEVSGSIGTPASQFSAGLNMPTDQNGDTIQYGETDPTATTSQITSSPSATSNHLMNGIRAPLQSQSLNANSNGASLGTSAMYNDGVPVAEGNGKFSGSVGTPAAQFSAGLNMATDQNGATIQHGETDPTATTSQISSSPSPTSNHLMNGIRAPLQSQSLTANSNAASLGVSDMYSNGVPEAGANGEVGGSRGTPAAQFSAGMNMPTDQNGDPITHGETDPTATTSQISSSPSSTSTHLLNGIRAPLQSQSLTANSNAASLGTSAMYNDGVPVAEANGEFSGSAGTPAAQFSAGLNMPTDQNGDTITHGETDPTATTSQISSSPSSTSTHLMNGIRAPLQSQSLTANSNAASLGASAMYNDGVPVAEANGEFSGSAGTPAAQFSAGLNMPTDQNGATIKYGETDPTATTSQISSSPSATSNHLMNGIRAPLQSQSLTDNRNGALLGTSAMYNDGVPVAEANGEFSGSAGTPAPQFSAGLNMPTDQNGATIQHGETDPTATTSKISSSEARVPVTEANGEFSGSAGTQAAQFSAALNMPTDQNGATIQYGETDPTATTSQISSSPTSTTNQIMKGIRAPLQSQSLTANSNGASLGTAAMYNDGVPPAEANGEFSGSAGTPAAQFSAGLNMPTDQNGATIQYGETDPTATTSQISFLTNFYN